FRACAEPEELGNDFSPVLLRNGPQLLSLLVASLSTRSVLPACHGSAKGQADRSREVFQKACDQIGSRPIPRVMHQARGEHLSVERHRHGCYLRKVHRDAAQAKHRRMGFDAPNCRRAAGSDAQARIHFAALWPEALSPLRPESLKTPCFASSDTRGRMLRTLS